MTGRPARGEHSEVAVAVAQREVRRSNDWRRAQELAAQVLDHSEGARRRMRDTFEGRPVSWPFWAAAIVRELGDVGDRASYVARIDTIGRSVDDVAWEHVARAAATRQGLRKLPAHTPAVECVEALHGVGQSTLLMLDAALPLHKMFPTTELANVLREHGSDRWADVLGDDPRVPVVTKFARHLREAAAIAWGLAQAGDEDMRAVHQLLQAAEDHTFQPAAFRPAVPANLRPDHGTARWAQRIYRMLLREAATNRKPHEQLVGDVFLLAASFVGWGEGPHDASFVHALSRIRTTPPRGNGAPGARVANAVLKGLGYNPKRFESALHGAEQKRTQRRVRAGTELARRERPDK